MDLTSLEEGNCGGDEEDWIVVVGDDDEEEDEERREIDAGDDADSRFTRAEIVSELPDDVNVDADDEEDDEVAAAVAAPAAVGDVVLEFPTGSEAETIIITVIQTNDFASALSHRLLTLLLFSLLTPDPLAPFLFKSLSPGISCLSGSDLFPPAPSFLLSFYPFDSAPETRVRVSPLPRQVVFSSRLSELDCKERGGPIKTSSAVSGGHLKLLCTSSQ